MVHRHHLASPTGSVVEFMLALAAAFPAAMQRDLEQVLTESVRRARRMEIVLMVNQRLDGEAAAAKVSRRLENQAALESEQPAPACLRQAAAHRDPAGKARTERPLFFRER